MIYRVMADVLVVLHLAFVIYAIGGGLLAFRWGWTVIVHLPAMLWGVVVESMGWVCPLTPMEIELRHAAGLAGYQGGFVDHYVLPILYPGDLGRSAHLLLGVALLGFNLVVYLLLLRRWRRLRSAGA